MFVVRSFVILVLSFLMVSTVFASERDYFVPDVARDIISKHAKDPVLQGHLVDLLQSNPEIRSLMYKIQAAHNDMSGAAWLDDPSFGVEVMNVPEDNASLSRTPMSGVLLAIKQKVPFPSKLVTKRRLKKAQLNQTQKIYLEQANQLIAKFKQSYFEYAYTREAMYIHNKNKSRLQSLNASLQSKYATNILPLVDLLKIKVAIGQIDNALIGLRQLSATHLARLNTLVLKPIDSKMEVNGQLQHLSSLPKDFSSLLDKALRFRPWLQKVDFEITEKEKQSSLAKQSLLPDFNFSGNYRVREGVAGDPVRGENFFGAGVAINVPFVWSLPRHTAKIAEAKNLLRAKKSEKEAVAQEVKYQVMQFYQEAKQLRDQAWIMSRDIIPASLSAFNSSKNSYETGVVDFLDVISSQNSLFSHELSLARYRYDFEKKRALLEMAVGDYF